MNQDELKVFFAILRSAISGNKLNNDALKAYSCDMLPDLLKLSAKHDIIHLLALGLKQNALIQKDNTDLEKYILKAVYWYERLRHQYKNLCDALEKAQIPFLPLKGSVIRKYYPEPWMRTSCDIDILVHEKDLEKAKSVLIEKCECVYHGKGSHDISLFAPTGVHVELHYDLVEDGRAGEASTVLKNIWSKPAIRHDFEYWNEMSDEMFYFYHIAHMAKHFEDGGCGIRPFIDLWILDNIQESNSEKRNQLLNHGRLLKFAEAARKLSRIWFENESYDFVSKQMEDYILRGGIYGNSENRITLQQQKKGGAVRFALSRAFLPYDTLKFHYPILQKHRWLTPVMEVRRWGRLLFCGHARRVTRELRFSQSLSKDTADQALQLLQDLGLA